jgi:hypothetical protein
MISIVGIVGGVIATCRPHAVVVRRFSPSGHQWAIFSELEVDGMQLHFDCAVESSISHA